MTMHHFKINLILELVLNQTTAQFKTSLF